LDSLRQVRHYRQRLDMEEARRILQRFHRLREATIETMDEDKARQSLEDLRARGLISPEEIPYEETHTTEVLIVRRAESEE
ncbi:MAG: hypothetical protein M1358_02925, partial [Chloroflexi bacterium]|nr:hypothetical protein [Chloroflexota bacterium]